MPGKTTSSNREGLITRDRDEGLDQAETTCGGRRVSRGVLKQEAESERKRRGFHSLGNKGPPRQGRESDKLGDGGRRKGEDLDVFSSPFRALAESCGFKVIREEEGSDSNSVRSQAGSRVSDCGDVQCHEDHVRRHNVDRVRPRRDTPGVDIHVMRDLSLSEGETSSGEETGDWPGLSDGNLVLQRTSPILSKTDSGYRGRIKEIESKDDNPQNDTRALEKHGKNYEHQHNAKRNAEYGVKKSKLSDHRPSGKDQKETLKSGNRQSKDTENENRHKKDYLTCRVGKYDACHYSSPVKTREEYLCSAEETESNGTYRTVKETPSPVETNFQNTYHATEKCPQTDEGHNDNAYSRQRSHRNFNESSNFIVQGRHIIKKPASRRQSKIFMGSCPDHSSPHETGGNPRETPDKRLAEHDRVKSMAQLHRDQSAQPNCRDKPNGNEYNDYVKVQPKAQADNVPDTQATESDYKIERKKLSAGSSFRISRVMTSGPMGPSCGVIRYIRSGPENDGVDNDQEQDVYTVEKAKKCPRVEDKQADFHLGAGDGNRTRCLNKGAVKTGKREGTRSPCRYRKEVAKHGDSVGTQEQTNDNAICWEKYEIKDGKINAKKIDEEDKQNYQRGRYVIKRGHLQTAGPNACDRLDNDRGAVEKQVLSEISKVRTQAAQERNKHEEFKAGYKSQTPCAPHEEFKAGYKSQTPCAPHEEFKAECKSQTSCPPATNKNKLNVGHIQFEREGVSKDRQTRPPDSETSIDEMEPYKPKEDERHGCRFDQNPLSPAPTSKETDALSYIHHHGHREDGLDNHFDDDPPRVDQLPACDAHPDSSDSNLLKQDNLRDECDLAPTCGCLHQTQRQGQNTSIHRQLRNLSQQLPQEEKHVHTHIPETEATTTDIGQKETREAHCAPQQKNQSFREALWPEHTQPGSSFSTTAHGCKNCVSANSFHPTPKSMDGVTTAAKTTKIESDDNTTKNHNDTQHPLDQQPPQPLPLPPHHHKESGFNINFNYEGSEAGDGGTPGSRFIGQYFLELWKNQCLCDVRLRVGNWSYLAHKIVLAAFSDFFCPNDPHCMPSICFDIPNATPDAVHQILLYLYSSEMEITDYSLESVLCAAESIGVAEVINLVKEILENPTPENFEHYLDIRARHGFPGRFADYTDLIREHLLDLTNSPYFLEIDLDDLQQILGDPEVKVDSEVDIIDVIARWVEFNPMERITYSADLLKFVNFDCISAECLADVVERKRHVFSREAFSIFLDAFKARSISAECPTCPQAQTMWSNVGAGGGPNPTLYKPPIATNKSTNADIYRPGQMQQLHQPPGFYEIGTQNKTLNGGNFQDSFRSPSKPRREGSRIPRSSQNKMSTLLGRSNGSGWTSDAPTSRPSTGMSSRQSSAPRRFATTQSSRMATPKEIMSMATRADCDQGAMWSRSGKHHRVNRVGGDSGMGGQQPRGSSTGRRGAGVYRCNNGNAVFSPTSDGDGNCEDSVSGTLPVSAMGGAPLWEESNPNTSQPTSPGWSRESGGSFVASPWISPGQSIDSLPPGCRSFRVIRGGRGPRWEQRSRSPSAGQGSRDRSSSKRVTFRR